ncbi:MAG: hypothetical protein NT076_02305 [Candidatus Pacearchaeota archaeon]|nr:hypothetical protein [Candidatus Pacearchaeota archaeon]
MGEGSSSIFAWFGIIVGVIILLVALAEKDSTALIAVGIIWIICAILGYIESWFERDHRLGQMQNKIINSRHRVT